MDYIIQILPSILSGLKMTIGVFVLTLIGSVPLGILVSLALRSDIYLLKWVMNAYVWIMRGTPLLLQIVFVYYGLSLANIMTLPRFEAAVVTFILNYAAYFAEIFRGGIQSIPDGQYDGAKVLGLSKFQTMRKIVLPQVFKIVMPSMGNEVVNLVKDSSLVYVIGLGDLMRAGNIAASRDVTLVPYLLVGLVYLVLIALATIIQRRTESKLNYYR
ncbi:amino acid ABC transporter permease [Weissella paramesenteroides]|jgi:polar amino acid transport system permease protein|uniref:ABC transporter, permease protein n=2 Tax=Weissella paramesenteroides TaxID=1249 RepID=C5RAI3_WEIPA|nr:amino acid ABC transporter permease [Weissella paramesenteroides]ATF40840.1 amino acid ABC transporter permease [Weissella paramesenteroides]EER74826.1 ABC transporter, permease protein [Weissella paramesenteroides ATCC 33313]KAA8439048.1 amino acid ABC transporter permease [Weissella paramesenteroides]KAA8440244.1 amino acid ABC transporter permease [Weissella paramesenteroides]KAA8443845.1 amino acid ABC transporter permease [Weissella paramesenteroides]